MSEQLIWRPKKGVLTAFVLSLTLGGVYGAANWSLRNTLRDIEELKTDQKQFSRVFGDDDEYLGNTSNIGVAAGICFRQQGGRGLSQIDPDRNSDARVIRYVLEGNESVNPNSVEGCIQESTGLDVEAEVSKKFDDDSYGLDNLLASTEDVREKVQKAYQTIEPLYEGYYERLKKVYRDAEEVILKQ